MSFVHAVAARNTRSAAERANSDFGGVMLLEDLRFDIEKCSLRLDDIRGTL